MELEAELDRPEHFRREPVEPHIRRAIPRRRIPQQLRHLRLRQHVQREPQAAAASEPLFVVQYKGYGGEKKSRRMSAQRVGKIVKALGTRVGVDTIHPHAFRHACGVELLKRSGGNLRAVQEHLRHADIETTTIYTRLAPQDLQRVVNLFDEKTGGETR